MRENVTISYRGARYEIGRGQHFYGIWVAGAPQAQPLEWWPETPVGWSHAWARFTGIEVPGTIVAVSPPAPPPPPPPAPPASQTAPQPGQTAGPHADPADPASAATPPNGLPAVGLPTSTAEPVNQAGESAAPAVASISGQQDTDPAGPADQPGVPVTPEGQPAALAVQPAALPGSSTPRARAGWLGNIAVGRLSGQASTVAGLSGQSSNGAGGLVSAALLAVGVIFGIVSLFPSYLDGASLNSAPASLVPHAIYFAAWFGAAVLILLGGARQRFGALLAVGTSVVTFGLFFADAGTAISGGAGVMGAGLTLGLIGWLVCAIGSGLAIRLKPGGQPVGRLRGFGVRHVLTVVAALGGLGTALAFAPSWDSYSLHAANGASQYITEGNAFSNPGWVITGDVLVMISVAVLVIAAAAWRPVREGGWLLAGVIIPMAAQGISALVQVSEATSPSQFGIPPAEASQAGITINTGLTPAFWLYGAFVVVLIVTCGWMLLSPRSAALDTPPQTGITPMAGGPAYLLPPGSVYAAPGALHAPMPTAPYRPLPAGTDTTPGGMDTMPGATGVLPGDQQVAQQQLGDTQRL